MAFIMANKGFWVSSDVAPSAKKGGMEGNHGKKTDLFHYDLKLLKNNSVGDLSSHNSNDLQGLHSNILHSL